VSTAVAVAVTEAAVESAPQLHLVTTPAADRAEENRWMLAFGLPCLFAGMFVATAIGTGQKWIWSFALLSLLVAICNLAWVAIASDANS
jgi:hypothetical protein